MRHRPSFKGVNDFLRMTQLRTAQHPADCMSSFSSNCYYYYFTVKFYLSLCHHTSSYLWDFALAVPTSWNASLSFLTLFLLKLHFLKKDIFGPQLRCIALIILSPYLFLSCIVLIITIIILCSLSLFTPYSHST